MRLFIAAFLPTGVERHLKGTVDRLNASTSTYLVPVENWHMTLAFIGEVEDYRVADAKDVVDRLATAAPTVRIGGGKRLGRNGAIVAGVRGEAGPLGDEVRAKLRRTGLTFDPRPLQPHVTIARKGDRMPAAEVAADMAVLDAYEGPDWLVDDIRLVSSRLEPTGPVYEML